MENKVYHDPWVKLLEGFRKRQKIKSLAEIARILQKYSDEYPTEDGKQFPESTVQEWFSNDSGPRKHSHQEAIEALLKAESRGEDVSLNAGVFIDDSCEVKYRTPIIQNLYAYMRRNGIETYAALGRLLEENSVEEGIRFPRNTVGGWFGNDAVPRQRVHIQTIQKLLDSEEGGPRKQEGVCSQTELDEARSGRTRIGEFLAPADGVGDGEEGELEYDESLEIRELAILFRIVLPRAIKVVRDDRALVRRTLVSELGEEKFSLLLSCMRALSSEESRKIVLREDKRFS